MTISDTQVLFVQGQPFLFVKMLRPKEDVKGSKSWYWSATAPTGEEISWGFVKNQRQCRRSARNAAKRWLQNNDGRQIILDKLKLSNQQIQRIEAEIKMMLHAHRDCLRNLGKDTSRIRFGIWDGYCGEAFGVLRALQVLGFGKFGAVNTPETKTNLSWWFEQLKDQVLKEENYGGSGVCEHCRNKYGKDDATVAERKRDEL